MKIVKKIIRKRKLVLKSYQRTASMIGSHFMVFLQLLEWGENKENGSDYSEKNSVTSFYLQVIVVIHQQISVVQ